MFILNMWTASLENGFFYNHNSRVEIRDGVVFVA
jgi:hypothetical protein